MSITLSKLSLADRMVPAPVEGLFRFAICSCGLDAQLRHEFEAHGGMVMSIMRMHDDGCEAKDARYMRVVPAE